MQIKISPSPLDPLLSQAQFHAFAHNPPTSPVFQGAQVERHGGGHSHFLSHFTPAPAWFPSTSCSPSEQTCCCASPPWLQFLQEISTFSTMGSYMGLQGDICSTMVCPRAAAESPSWHLQLLLQPWAAPHTTLQRFALSETHTTREAPPAADGHSCALQWGCWSSPERARTAPPLASRHCTWAYLGHGQRRAVPKDSSSLAHVGTIRTLFTAPFTREELY